MNNDGEIFIDVRNFDKGRKYVNSKVTCI